MAQIRIDRVTGIQHDHLVGDAGLQLRQGQLLAQMRRIATGHRAHETVEGAEGVRTADAVGRDAHALLELTQGGVGVPAEEAVGSARREAELVQAPLEFRDVVTGHEVTGHVGEHAVTELPSRLVQPPEGVRADDAVDGDAALLLERTHGTVELVIELLRVGDVLTAQAERGKARPHLGDGRADVTSTQESGHGTAARGEQA